MNQILYLLLGAILLLGSGCGILWLIPSLRRALTPLEWIPCALLISSGVVAVAATLGRVAGLAIAPWSIILLAISIVIPLLGLAVQIRRGWERSLDPGPRSFVVVLLVTVAAIFLLMLREGGSLGPVHDSLDFVAFVQETLQTGDLSPHSAIYHVGPEVPADPRRGSFHTQIAALCYVTGTKPTDGWRWLPCLLAPLAVLGLGLMLRSWIGARAAWLATLVFIAAGLLGRDHFLQNIGYASRVGWVCGWAALLALARGLQCIAGNRRSEARWLLLLSAAGPLILFAVHLLSGFQVLLALGCAGIAVWADRSATRGERKATLFTLAGATALLLPAVLIRLSQSISVGNPLFDHLYGVLFVAPGWPVLYPGYFTERFGIVGVAGALLGLTLLRGLRKDRAAGFLACSTAIPLLILFFPPIVRIVLAAHAHSILFRVILTIPYAGTLAWITLWAVRSLREGSGWLRRLRSAGVLLIVVGGIAGQAVLTRSDWMIPEKRRADYKENAALLLALEGLNDRFPNVQTILSDPISSYSIPAYTHHDAVATYQQHSSPTDPSVPQRIRDVQEALNGRVGMARTFAVLRHYHVDLILLNQTWKRFVPGYYSFISPLAYEEQREKFDGAPDLFERIYDTGGIAVYRVHDPGPGAVLKGDLPNPDRIPDPGGTPLITAGPVELLRLAPRPEGGKRGEMLPFDVVWRRNDTAYTLPILCEVKLQHERLPAGYTTPILGRITRIVTERREHTMIRFGWTFLPTGMWYPDFLWAPGESYKDALWVPVPPMARAGTYEVWVRLALQPYAKVARLDEMVSNRLGPEWHRLAEVTIAR